MSLYKQDHPYSNGLEVCLEGHSRDWATLFALVADRLQRIELKLESAEKEIAELKATLLDENVYSQTKEALEMALLMLDEENQPPQWTREEVFTD